MNLSYTDKQAFQAAVEGYYSLPDNGAGGWCHLVLDDKNVDDLCIATCYLDCSKVDDVYGMILMTWLRSIPRDKRESYVQAQRY